MWQMELLQKHKLVIACLYGYCRNQKLCVFPSYLQLNVMHYKYMLQAVHCLDMNFKGQYLCNCSMCLPISWISCCVYLYLKIPFLFYLLIFLSDAKCFYFLKSYIAIHEGNGTLCQYITFFDSNLASLQIFVFFSWLFCQIEGIIIFQSITDHFAWPIGFLGPSI